MSERISPSPTDAPTCPTPTEAVPPTPAQLELNDENTIVDGHCKKISFDQDTDTEPKVDQGEKAAPAIKRKVSMKVQGDGLVEPLQWSRRFAGGLRADLKRKAPYCLGDWADALKADNRSTVLASTIFLFFACLSAALTFGVLFDESTDGQLGVIEMILSSAISGLFYSVLSGQPFCIMGATGPELAYTVVFYNLCKSLDLEFLPARVWEGLWCSFFTVLIAVFDLSALMSHVTRFTEEIFAALISIMYIVRAFENVIKVYFEGADLANLSEAFMGTLLFIGTYKMSIWCKKNRGSKLFLPIVRNTLANYGVTIAILVFTGVAAIFPMVPLSKLSIPDKFEPTYVDPSTGQVRSWIINPMGYTKPFPVWGIFFTMIPAAGLALLGYLDQNLTSILINRKSHNLKKPPAYHLDMLVCGLCIYPVCAIMGLPFTHAATVRSMTHLISLSTRESVDLPGGGTTTKVTKVVEQRVTNFGIHFLIAICLLFAPALRIVPKPVLYGVFLYMGVTSIPGNEIFDRIFLWSIWDVKYYPGYRFVGTVTNKSMHLYTFFQVACIAGLFAMTKIDAISVIFPFMIGLLVFVRKTLKWFWSQADLAILDG